MCCVLEASHGPGGGLGHLRSRPRPVGRARRPVPSRSTVASRRRPRLQLRRQARAAAEAADRQGEFSPGRSVSLSSERARGGGRVVDLQSWSASSRVVCARWGSGVQGTPEEGIGRRALFASRLLSWSLYVRACWHGSSVESRLASRAPVSSSVSPWLARGVAITSRHGCCSLLHHARAASARSALCACFGGWGCGAF